MNDYINPEEEREQQKEEILLNENQLLDGLLQLGKIKMQDESARKIQIKRGGVLLLEFRIRPVSEDESQDCWKRATKYAPYKPGQPRKAIETNTSLFRSHLIYTATVDEDRAKVWDNRQAQTAMQIFQGVDMIDRVLLAGEKSRVIDIIDEISGFDDDLNEQVKN